MNIKLNFIKYYVLLTSKNPTKFEQNHLKIRVPHKRWYNSILYSILGSDEHRIERKTKTVLNSKGARSRRNVSVACSGRPRSVRGANTNGGRFENIRDLFPKYIWERQCSCHGSWLAFCAAQRYIRDWLTEPPGHRLYKLTLSITIQYTVGD